LIEDILDTLMRDLQGHTGLDAFCLARTCHAEHTRYTQLALSLPITLSKILRHVSRAGRVSQFQFLCTEWGVPARDIRSAAARTTNVSLWEWAVADADPLVCLPHRDEHRYHSWTLLQHYHHRNIPFADLDFLSIFSDLDLSHGQAEFIVAAAPFVDSLPRHNQYGLLFKACGNRHIPDPAAVLQHGPFDETDWEYAFGLAVKSCNMPVIQYMTREKKVILARHSWITNRFEIWSSNLNRTLDFIQYAATEGQLTFTLNFTHKYLHVMGWRWLTYCEPFNPIPCKRLLDLGMPVSDQAPDDHVVGLWESLCWIRDNYKQKR
jgi:hypothetical protein